MPKTTDELKQIHIYVPTSLYNDVKAILPEKGMTTSLIRRFLRKYVAEYKARSAFKSPSDIAADEIIKEDEKRG